MSILSVQGLERAYGAHRAVRGISFAIARGEVVGLLGPNGAGKTTTLQVIAGLLAPTAGTVTVAGIDVLTDPRGAAAKVGFLPEDAPLPPELSAREVLRFTASVRGLGPAETAAAIDRVARRCGLLERLDAPTGTLSKGFRQRVGLAAALLHDPALLILDEPANGLDPEQIVGLRALVRELGRERAVILSTHVLPEVEAACDRVLILGEGRLLADGPVAEVVARARGDSLILGLGPSKIVENDASICAALGRVPGVRGVALLAPDGPVRRLRVHGEGELRPALLSWAADRGHPIWELSPERGSLESVFRALVSDGAPPPG